MIRASERGKLSLNIPIQASRNSWRRHTASKTTWLWWLMPFRKIEPSSLSAASQKRMARRLPLSRASEKSRGTNYMIIVLTNQDPGPQHFLRDGSGLSIRLHMFPCDVGDVLPPGCRLHH